MLNGTLEEIRKSPIERLYRVSIFELNILRRHPKTARDLSKNFIRLADKLLKRQSPKNNSLDPMRALYRANLLAKFSGSAEQIEVSIQALAKYADEFFEKKDLADLTRSAPFEERVKDVIFNCLFYPADGTDRRTTAGKLLRYTFEKSLDVVEAADTDFACRLEEVLLANTYHLKHSFRRLLERRIHKLKKKQGVRQRKEQAKIRKKLLSAKRRQGARKSPSIAKVRLLKRPNRVRLGKGHLQKLDVAA